MKFNNKWVVALAATLLLSACGSDEEKTKKDVTNEEQTTSKNDGAPYTVVDDRGVDHRVGDIDPLEVAAAHRVRRPVDLARPQREPPDAADVAG